jgi:hypothetical protein
MIVPTPFAFSTLPLVTETAPWINPASAKPIPQRPVRTSIFLHPPLKSNEAAFAVQPLLASSLSILPVPIIETNNAISSAMSQKFIS